MSAEHKKVIIGQPPRAFRRYLPEEEIQRAVRATATQITAEYAGRQPVFVGVLTGCFTYIADLVRQVELTCTVDFVKLSSYRNGMEAGRIQLIKDIDTEIRDRDVILVDDIVDTGNSWDFLRDFLLVRHPASLRMAACFRKPKSLQAGVHVDYVSLDLPDEFVVGYGLDYAGEGRNLPDLYILDNESSK